MGSQWSILLFVNILILGLVGFSQDATAEIKTAVQSGDWCDPDTWGGTVPTPTEDVLIPSGITVSLSCLDSDNLAPLKQMKKGVLPEDIQCNEGLDLIFKPNGGIPTCVKPTTAEKLLERGWTSMTIISSSKT